MTSYNKNLVLIEYPILILLKVLIRYLLYVQCMVLKVTHYKECFKIFICVRDVSLRFQECIMQYIPMQRKLSSIKNHAFKNCHKY